MSNDEVIPSLHDFYDATEGFLVLSVFGLNDGDLAGEELNLLSEVDELLFEGLSVSQSDIEFTLEARSLGALFAVEAFELGDALSEERVVLLALLELRLEELVVADGDLVLLDSLAEAFDLGDADVQVLLESADLFVETGDLGSLNAEGVDFNRESLDARLFFVEEEGETLELLLEVGDLAFEDLDLSVGLLEFDDASAESSDLNLVGLELAGEELDLLGEVDELLFESLTIALSSVEIAFLAGSLHAFLVEAAGEFLDSLDEEETVLFGFLELNLETSDADHEGLVVGDASLELFDLGESLAVGDAELVEFLLDAAEVFHV